MSELQIFTCEQNSPEWLACRLGIPTASKFAMVMAKGRSGGDSLTRRDYMFELIGQRRTGVIEEGYTNKHMDRGHEWEPDARNLYSMVADVEPQQIGFLRRGDVGASPDSLIGNDGLLEIKTRLQKLQIALLLADEVPPEHKAQIQGQLWVSGREWIDFVSYHPGLEIFVRRVYREESYIATIKVAVDDFLDEMHGLIAKLDNRRAAA